VERGGFQLRAVGLISGLRMYARSVLRRCFANAGGVDPCRAISIHSPTPLQLRCRIFLVFFTLLLAHLNARR